MGEPIVSGTQRAAANMTPTAISARFPDTQSANRATRALQKELKLRPEHVSVSMEPGTSATADTVGSGYIGLTKRGALIVNARAIDPIRVAAIREVLTRSGGEVIEREFGASASGGYGPTTANGTRGLFGGQARTSALAHQEFTHGPSDDPTPG
jgi:hypothetical protein